MAPRANWKGYLKLSLVSCPVALFPAASTSEKISFHLLNGATGHRLKQQYVDAETGEPVEREDRVKGYEIAKDEYIIVSDEELAKIEIESSHTINIDSFVKATEVDPVYLDTRYYIAPNDKVGEEAFAVIRDAMRQRQMVGIAHVVLYGRERTILLEPREKGIMGTTLRYAYEVRDDAAYFDEIPKIDLAKDMLELASHIIDMKTAKFDPSQFKDHYQDAVVELIRSKRAGQPAPVAHAPAPSNVVNLMDALRRSLGSQNGLNTPAGSTSDKPAEAPTKRKTRKAESPAEEPKVTARRAPASKSSSAKGRIKKAG